MAGRANGLQVIDGPYVKVRDTDGFREFAQRAQILGYDGKWALHPDQVQILNELFSPTQEQFDKAWDILDDLREGDDRGRPQGRGDARRRDDRRGEPQGRGEAREPGRARRHAAQQELSAGARI